MSVGRKGMEEGRVEIEKVGGEGSERGRRDLINNREV